MQSSRVLATAVASVLAGHAAAVWGADSGAPIIEEVIVSVERVTQTLQSYEGTAAVVSQSALDTLGASDLVDDAV